MWRNHLAYQEIVGGEKKNFTKINLKMLQKLYLKVSFAVFHRRVYLFFQKNTEFWRSKFHLWDKQELVLFSH